MARARVTVPHNGGASLAAGLAAHYGSISAAARASGVSRGVLDGLISGRQGMGEKTRGRIETHLNDRSAISSGDAKRVKDLGRTIEYTSAGRVKASEPGQKTVRSEVNRIRGYDDTNKRKEVSFFVRRMQEVKPSRPARGGGGGGGVGGGGAAGNADEASDEEWFAEYGAWVEEIEAWEAEAGDLPDIEELPF